MTAPPPAPGSVDLPDIIYWKLQFTTLMSVLGPPALVATAEARDGNGVAANKAVLGHRIPYGVRGWRLTPLEDWKHMNRLPPEWKAALKQPPAGGQLEDYDVAP